MNGAGRPLRFLVGVTSGWTLLRVAMLWTGSESVPEMVREIVVPKRAAAAVGAPALPGGARLSPVQRVSVAAIDTQVRVPVARPASAEVATITPTNAPPTSVGVVVSTTLPRSPSLPEVIPLPLTQPVTRPAGWSVSGWAFVRAGSGVAGAAPGSQLGGSQLGFRVDRAIVGGLAATARFSAPIEGRGAEAAVGLAWTPRGVPLRAVVEHRFALDGGRGGLAVGVSGGVSDVALPRGVRLEAYGQAGAIARDEVEPYADGAARVATSVARSGRLRVDLGAGVWGAAQRGAERLDIGPSIALRGPIAGGGARLQLDWRQRIAGNARPGSGPALTLGADL